MKKILFVLTILVFATPSLSQTKEIPNWFLDDLAANIGIWTTDNSKYLSENETIDTYEMVWEWGIGNTSITGRLYGYKDGEQTSDFWEFRNYWDNIKGKATIIQFGNGGVIGEGYYAPLNDTQIESIQSFSLKNGQTWSVRHLLELNGNSLVTTSFDEDDTGKWIESRTYTWKKTEK